ncbi:hypothetical protein BJY01DRAFT_253076 [Aspergillus pseudoustus]|uniref:Cyanovirin-N domain-containing protein n=1 Tax=Aspergillus pseudoustus TaxID=1810923 RepID=A0ABR4J6B5_9EURO
MIATAKTFLLAAVLGSTGALGAVQATFNRYFAAECSTALGAVTLVEGYCVNLESFPTLSWDASVTSGACADASASPVVKIFTDPGCETGLVSGNAIGAGAQCVEEDSTIQSVTLVCE